MNENLVDATRNVHSRNCMISSSLYPEMMLPECIDLDPTS